MQLLQQGRRGNAQNILSAVQARNEEIQKIERDLIELAQLFQDLDATVIQQEAAVQNIEQQGEQVEENVAKANVEIGGAINSARAARRKKFWCLGIASESHDLRHDRVSADRHKFSSSSSSSWSLSLSFWCYKGPNSSTSIIYDMLTLFPGRIVLLPRHLLLPQRPQRLPRQGSEWFVVKSWILSSPDVRLDYIFWT